MRPSKRWIKPGELYIIDINGKTKFGICRCWKRRLKLYEKEFPNLSIKVYKRFSFDKYWKVELIEAMMRYRLKPFIVPGRKEYVHSCLPLQSVIDCYTSTVEIVSKEFSYCEQFHWYPQTRYDDYKNFYRMIEGSFG